ncbi:hypothetical protein BZA77DRAFT_308197 [Pyronema omphalodes]|nr:hypothetical protein BZA77DRAFT_308197 [Pyronema omphalodes]
MRCRPCRNNPPNHHLPPNYAHVLHAATGYGPHLPLLSCYSKWSPVMRAPSAIRLLVCGSVLLLAGNMPCSRHYFGVCPPESSPPKKGGYLCQPSRNSGRLVTRNWDINQWSCRKCQPHNNHARYEMKPQVLTRQRLIYKYQNRQYDGRVQTCHERICSRNQPAFSLLWSKVGKKAGVLWQ